MGDFRKLQAWQRAHGLVVAVYQLTEALPASERFGLTGQMRRAALSVALAGRRLGRAQRQLKYYLAFAGLLQEWTMERHGEMSFLMGEDSFRTHDAESWPEESVP